MNPEHTSQPFDRSDIGRPDFIGADSAKKIGRKVYAALAEHQGLLLDMGVRISHHYFPLKNGSVGYQLFLSFESLSREDGTVKATTLCDLMANDTSCLELKSGLEEKMIISGQERRAPFTFIIVAYRDFMYSDEYMEYPEVEEALQTFSPDVLYPDREPTGVSVTIAEDQGRYLYSRDNQQDTEAYSRAWDEIQNFLTEEPEFRVSVVAKHERVAGRDRREIELLIDAKDAEQLTERIDSLYQLLDTWNFSTDITHWLMYPHQHVRCNSNFTSAAIRVYQNYQDSSEFEDRHSQN